MDRSPQSGIRATPSTHSPDVLLHEWCQSNASCVLVSDQSLCSQLRWALGLAVRATLSESTVVKTVQRLALRTRLLMLRTADQLMGGERESPLLVQMHAAGQVQFDLPSGFLKDATGLPLDVWLQLCQHLSPLDLARLSGANRAFRSFVRECRAYLPQSNHPLVHAHFHGRLSLVSNSCALSNATEWIPSTVWRTTWDVSMVSEGVRSWRTDLLQVTIQTVSDRLLEQIDWQRIQASTVQLDFVKRGSYSEHDLSVLSTVLDRLTLDNPSVRWIRLTCCAELDETTYQALAHATVDCRDRCKKRVTLRRVAAATSAAALLDASML